MTIICENHDYFNYLKIILLISAVDNLAAYYGSLAHDIFPDVSPAFKVHVYYYSDPL